MATTMSSGPLHELVVSHDEVGILAALDAVGLERRRAGIEDRLLRRTLAALPFTAASLSGATELLFKEPAILPHLGRAAAQIREGATGGKWPTKREIDSLASERRREAGTPRVRRRHGPHPPAILLRTCYGVWC